METTPEWRHPLEGGSWHAEVFQVDDNDDDDDEDDNNADDDDNDGDDDDENLGTLR